MRLLIDAHALIWYVDGENLLGLAAQAAMTDPENELLLSAGTIWEISIKAGLRKLVLSVSFHQWMTQAMSDLGVVLLPLTLEHADAQARLPKHHRDPFDRLLVAQAQVESVAVISADPIFDLYGISRVW